MNPKSIPTGAPHRTRIPCIAAFFRKRWRVALVAALAFASVTTWNFSCFDRIDPLIFDTQFYANSAYNFALGRGFSFVNVGDCSWELMAPEDLREAIVDPSGPAVPNNLRSPGGTVWLGSWLWLARLDLKRAVLLQNFFGLWAIGFFLFLIAAELFGKSWTGVLVLLIHFAVLPAGWTTLYPVIPVNLFVCMLMYFGHRWKAHQKRGDLFGCAAACALLVVTRFHFVLFLPVLAVFLWRWSSMKPVAFARSGLLLLCAPSLVLIAAWTIRNGVVLRDWAFEGRGVIHFFFRAYPGGWGSYFYPEAATFPGIIESIVGQIPERAKRADGFQALCVPQRNPAILEIPAALRPYTLLAAIKLIVSHPGAYLLSGYYRLKEMWTVQYSPPYVPRKTLFYHRPTQTLLQRLHITDGFLLIMYPMKWYLFFFLAGLCFALACAVGRRPVPTVAVMALSITLYNAFVLIFLSDNLGGYLNFSWPATLVAVVGVWGAAMLRISSLVASRKSRSPGMDVGPAGNIRRR